MSTGETVWGHGAIGVLSDAEGRFLVVRRAMHLTSGGLWCFPGGHVEPGESPDAAVVRELREELDIDVEVTVRLGQVTVTNPHYRLDTFVVRHVARALRLNRQELTDTAWLDVADIRSLEGGMFSNLQVVDLLKTWREGNPLPA